jgi:hypothetical protein
MKSVFYLLIIGCILLSLLIAGCGTEKARSSQEAIDNARSIQNVVERADYLISQAKAFYNAKDFKNTVDISIYVIQYLDSKSRAAHDLLERSNSALKAQSRLQATDVMRLSG